MGTLVLKPELILKAINKYNEDKNAIIYVISGFPTLWLILLGAMERLHSFRNKSCFSFTHLHKECLDSAIKIVEDSNGMLYKYEKKVALKAFSQLISMNFCQYVYHRGEEEKYLINNKMVKLIVHGDVIISAIKRRFVCQDAFLNGFWVD